MLPRSPQDRSTPVSACVFALGLLLAVLALGACSSGESVQVVDADSGEVVDDSTSDDSTSDDSASDDSTGDVAAATLGKPNVVVPDGPAPTELYTEDLVVGDGHEAAAGDFLTMHYVGVRHSDGGQFDASWDSNRTFDLVLGAGQVIRGWDEGIPGMRVGGRRLLSIPSDMAYGDRELGDDIPANSALVFVVDLLAAVPPPTVENADVPVTDLEIEVITAGDGAEISAGSTVKLLYVAVLQRTGEVFDSSWITGRAAGFVVGAEPSQAIPAWDQGLVGRRVGDHIRLVIPPGMGLPDSGGPIGADDTIITELIVLDVA